MSGLRSFLWLAFPSSHTSKTIIRMLTFRQQCPTAIHLPARPLPDIFFDTRPSLILKIIGYRLPRNIGYYPIFQVIPNILGLPEIPEIAGNTRLFSIPDPNPPAIAKTSSFPFVTSTPYLFQNVTQDIHQPLNSCAEGGHADWRSFQVSIFWINDC